MTLNSVEILNFYCGVDRRALNNATGGRRRRRRYRPGRPRPRPSDGWWNNSGGWWGSGYPPTRREEPDRGGASKYVDVP